LLRTIADIANAFGCEAGVLLAGTSPYCHGRREPQLGVPARTWDCSIGSHDPVGRGVDLV